MRTCGGKTVYVKQVAKIKIITKAMKTHILDSATAGHGDSLNLITLLKFFKLRLLWPLYIETTNIQ